MIWDRDYMKRQDDPHQVANDSESDSQAPEPFNLFAGLQPEPLQPTSDSSTVKPVAADQPAQILNTAAIPGPMSDRNPWVYVTIAIIALVIGLVLGGQFLN